MTTPPGNFDDGKDHRTVRVYEGKVTEPSPFDDQLDLDHGYDNTRSRRHIWTDSSCWLKDLSGQRVRITVEVLPADASKEVA